jgi:hypothetical protein
VAEGDSLLFTGFPIGGVLGLFPATHRAMIAAIAPVAIPSASGQRLDPKSVRRLRDAAFSVFQLDATAYPGNSGSPLYDPATGEVVGILNMVFVKATKESALTQSSGTLRHSITVPDRSACSSPDMRFSATCRPIQFEELAVATVQPSRRIAIACLSSLV